MSVLSNVLVHYWESGANVALHHSVGKQTSTTWKREPRDGEDGNRREPPTSNRDAVMLAFIKTAPLTVLPSSVWLSLCLLLSTTTDAGRRESTTDILAKIIPLHAATNTRCKITPKKKVT